nr:M3 family metallopeptidase [Candidatus Gracilibacteria bacterium]
MTIKQKILQELQNPKMLDLKFLFSKEVLDVSLEVLQELLDEEKKDFDEILKLTNEKITFETFMDFSKLDLFFSLLNHLQNVKSSDEIRNIIEDFEPKYVDFGNYIAYNKRYYDMIVYCKNNCNLDNEQKRILDLSIKSYEVKGINLEEEKQNRLKEISKRLSELSQKFGNNLLDSEKEFKYVFETDETIKDIPQNELEEAKIKAEKEGKTGYLFDSSPASYMAIMKYCTESDVRKHFFTEKHKFASSGKFDNRKLVLEILKLRDEKSHILGYKNYAELSLVFKMADTPENVIKLIDEVSIKAKDKAETEIVEFKKYFNLADFNPWDLAYYSRIYKEKEFNFDERELKKYFEFDKVLNGLFTIANKLYGIEMREVEIDSYSSDIRFYEVYKEGKLISYFVGDYFYNQDKRSGAWCDNMRPKIEYKGKTYIPIVVNVCAFLNQGTGKTLLNFIDVETMFHEFGHALHEMLSKSKYSDLSGFNVEWDFVELPSQLMENWCNEEESLKLFAKHNETGEEIPKSMLETMDKLKKYGTGNFTLRQNEFASLDMHLHSKVVPDNIEKLDDFVLDFINNYGIFKKDKDYKMYASFSHIFDGGYGAGYYSYMWAEIIEAQVWSIFKNKGIFDKETADRFLKTILSAGTTKDASMLFEDFAGVSISPNAFLDRKKFL